MGVCSCFGDWIGAGCTCSTSICREAQNKDCDIGGQCSCLGAFTGATCQQCRDGLYGVGCTLKCDCNGNGACDINTGLCRCYQNSVNGYWSGGTCNQCSSGYMGVTCQQLSNVITQPPDLVRKSSVQANFLWYYLDTVNRFLYIGGTPFMARFNVATIVFANPVTATLSVCGDVILGMPSPRNNSKFLFLTMSNNSCAGVSPRLGEGTYSTNGPLSDYSIIMNNTIDNNLNPISTSLSWAFIDPVTNNVCGYPLQAQSLYCRRLLDPSAELVVQTFQTTSMRAVKRSNWFSEMMIAAQPATGNTACAFLRASFLGRQTDSGISEKSIPVAVNVRSQLNKPCLSLDCFCEYQNFIIYGFFTDAAYIGAYDLEKGVFLRVALAGGSSKCNDIIYDGDSDMGFAVFGNKVVKYDFKGASIRAYGQIYVTYNNIAQLIVDSPLQVVYAPLSVAGGFIVSRFLLVEVNDFTPKYADRLGSALITVIGKGFRNNTGAFCTFDSDKISSVTVINNTVLTCEAPPIVSSAVCLSQTLEVSINGFNTTNRLVIQRPLSVQITTISPTSVRVGDNITVTMTGSQFTLSPHAMCRFSDPEISSHVFFSTALFENQTYSCLAPNSPEPWSGTSYAQITLDGFVYSATAIPFLIIGAASRIIADPSSYANVSSPITTIESPPISVFVADALGNRLLSVDTAVRHGSVTGPGQAIVNPNASSRNGVIEFKSFGLIRPPVGTMLFTISVSEWEASILITINSGQLAQLIVTAKSQPSGTIVPGQPLPTTLEINALDVGGNLATSASGIAIGFLLCEYTNGTTDTGPTSLALMKTIISPTAAATLGAVPVYPVFGTTYVIFAAVLTEAQAETWIMDIWFRRYVPLINVSTIPFKAGCPPTQYQVIGGTECQPCDVERFSCNGTHIVVALEGNWRAAAQSLTFYSCPVPGACLPGGTCAKGYTGILCSVCDEGYGQDYTGACSVCPSFLVSLFAFVGFGAGMFAFVLFVTIITVQTYSVPDSINRILICGLCIGFFYFQSLELIAFIDMGWPKAVRDFFFLLGMVFSLKFAKAQAVHCLFSRFGLNNMHIALLYAAVFLMFPIVAGMAWLILKRFPDIFAPEEAIAKRQKIQETAAAMAKYNLQKRMQNSDGTLYVKEHQRKALLLAAAQIICNFNFQAAVSSVFQLYDCTAIDMGNKTMISVVRTDPRVNCNSPQYAQIAPVLSFLSFVYVAVFPLVAIFGVAVAKKRFEPEDFLLYTSFPTLGTRDVAFFWNGLLFFRRAIVTAIVNFLQYPLQAYLGVWTLTCFLWVLFYLRPWKFESNTKVDLATNFSVVCCANFALIFLMASESLISVSGVVLIVSQCCVMAYVAYETLIKAFIAHRRVYLYKKRFVGSMEVTSMTEMIAAMENAEREQRLAKQREDEENAKPKTFALMMRRKREMEMEAATAGPTTADIDLEMQSRENSEKPKGLLQLPTVGSTAGNTLGTAARRLTAAEQIALMRREDDGDASPDFDEVSDVDSELSSGDNLPGSSSGQPLDRTHPANVRAMELNRDIDEFIMSKQFSLARHEGSRQPFNSRVAQGQMVAEGPRPPQLELLLRSLQQRERSNSQKLDVVLKSVLSSEDDDL
jgi:hypothetical protein